MNPLRRNLQALAAADPDLSHALAELPAGAGANGQPPIRTEEARSGDDTVRLGDGTYLASRHDPAREAAAWADRVAPDATVVVLFGFGLGYHVERLLQRDGLQGLLVVEPEQRILRAALQTRRLQDVLSDRRLRVFCDRDAYALMSQLRPALARAAADGGWSFVAWPAYERHFATEVKELQQALLDLTRTDRVNLASHEQWTVPWIHNVLANLPLLDRQPYLHEWFGALAGRPVILAASGPSLTAELPLLRQLQGHVPIVAAGSSFNALLGGGVEPDLVVSYDGSDANYGHFAGSRLEAPLAFAAIIHPRIPAEHRGPLIPFALRGDTFFSYLLRIGGHAFPQVPMGPSVANTTLAILHQLGADPVVLVGQDLAFPGDRVHAEGVRGLQHATERFKRAYVWTEDVRDGRVPSIRSFYAMKVWFERYLRSAGRGLTVINTSQAGARIAGTREMTLADAAGRFALDRQRSQPGLFAEPPAGAPAEPLGLTPAAVAEGLEAHLASLRPLARSCLKATDRARTALRLGDYDQAGEKRALLRLTEGLTQLRQHQVYKHLIEPMLHYRTWNALEPGVTLNLGNARHRAQLRRWLDRCHGVLRHTVSAVAFLEAVAAEAGGRTGTPAAGVKY